MKFNEFTKEQQSAIVADGSNVLVSAGAGSGKTQVLTARVVYFIKNKGYKLNQFLILTFTKLAAGEMKERIRKELSKEGLEDAKDVDSASICTFDSYALNIVKKYHFLLKISPNVSIVDSNIIEVKERDILDEIFERLYKERNPEFCSLIKDFCLKSDKNIRELILEVYKKSLLEIDTDDYLDHFEDIYYSKEKCDEIAKLMAKKIAGIRKKVAEVAETIPSSCQSKASEDIASMPLASFVATQYEGFFKASDYDSLVSSYKEVGSDTKKLIPGSSKSWSLETSSAITSLKKYLVQLDDLIDALPLTKEDLFNELRETKPYAKTIVKIIKELDGRIMTYKSKNGAYEFTDIAKMALELVKNNKEVREEIKSNLKMIMIDEYQDTSALQDNFISYISDNNVYMVGDVKQSIYRFRNADVSIFINKYRDYKKNGTGQVIDLNKNFRSRREVLDDINYIFKQIMTERCGGADYRNEHMIQFGNTNFNSEKSGYKGSSSHTHILSYALAEGEKTSASKEAELIARDIIDKLNNGYKVMDFKEGKPYLRPATFKDFCILMDRGTSFNDYQKVFNDYKLPIYVENDEDITNNEIVLVLTSLLKMIDFVQRNDTNNPYFEKAWLSLARSFVYGYSDEKVYVLFKEKDLAHEPITAEIRSFVLDNASLSSYKLFEKLIYHLDIYGKCVSLGNIENSHKYLDYFLSMFKSMSDLSYSVNDFIAFLENVNDDDNLKIKISSTGTSIDSIRLMNVHKSKGLEFNIVYLSGTFKGFNHQEERSSCGFSSKFGLILPKDPSKANVIKLVNAEYESQEETSEKIRQLYVALTRTREQLIIPMQEEPDEETPTKKDLSSFVQGIYQSYADKAIDFAGLLSAMKAQGLEPTFQFVSMEDEQRHSIPFNKANDYFAEIGETIEDPSSFDSFRDMLLPFIHTDKFVKYSLPETNEKPSLVNPPSEIVHHNLEVKPLNIEYHQIESFHPSKQLDLTANKSSLEFGTKMHFLMETMDFVNPDYSGLSDNEKLVVERFLKTPFMANVKEGKVYKEYEYYDEENNVNGIIDLMIVYPDHIDVVDYKTKHIDDASYDKQISIYMDMAERTFNKDTKGYLYSLMTGEYKGY